VRDDQLGNRPQSLPRVCDLSARDDEAVARENGARAIGLTLAKNLIDLHGAVIEARSAGVGGGDVLVVDDNEDAAEMLAELLTDWGCTVRIAHDGHKALELARERTPDLVLLDIGLPGISGHEVARALRADGSPVRIVALSGYGQESDVIRSKDAGCDAHLVKPIDAAGLRKLLC
jgi:CheY-like chemotaxis protein